MNIIDKRMKTFHTLLIKHYNAKSTEDKELIKISQNSKGYSIQNFHGANTKYTFNL